MTENNKTKDNMQTIQANLIHKSGDTKAIKSYVSEDGNYGFVEGYLVSWGSPQDTDLQGEYFTPNTEFCLDWFVERPVLYHHGLDGEAGLRKIGKIKSVVTDELGLWVTAQLDLRDRYSRAVYDMVKSADFGWSSGSVDHLVKIADSGEIAVWPLIEGSITPTPAQPSKTAVRAMKSNRTFVPSVSYRAFKSVLKEDIDFVRGLENRVRVQDSKSSKRTGPHRPTKDAYQETINETLAKMQSENEETLAGLEDEMTQESSVMKINRSARSRKNQEAQELEAIMSVEVEEEIEALASDLAEKEMVRRFRSVSRSKDVDLEEEFDEEFNKYYRAIRQKALRRAKQLAPATNDLEATIEGDYESTIGGVGDEEPLGDFASEKRYGRSRRGYARRNADVNEAILTSLDEIRNDQSALRSEIEELRYDNEAARTDDAALVELIAEKAYANGKRSALRRKTQTDVIEPADIEIDGATVEDVENLASKRAAMRRKNAQRRAWRDEDIDVIEEDFDDEEDFDEDDLEEAVASYGGYRSDDEDEAIASVRRAAYRKTLKRLKQQEGFASDEDEAILSDVLGEKRYRAKAAKSVDTNSAEYWRQRAIKAEQAEAPNQRGGFSRIGSITDEADREGAYTRAFKSWMRGGLNPMSETEKRILYAKGTMNNSDVRGTSWLGDPAVKGYFGSVDPSGGFAVPPDWADELNTNIMAATAMAAECRTRTTTSDTLIQPNVITTDARRAGSAVVRWPGDEQVADPTLVHSTESSTFSQLKLPIHLAMLHDVVSNNMLEDASFNTQDYISQTFAEAMAVDYDTFVWSGDGQGKPQGIVTNEQVTGHESLGTATVGGYVPSGSIYGLTNTDALVRMYQHLPAGYRKNAKWYMSQDTGRQLMELKNANGDPLFFDRNSGMYGHQMPELLYGRPIVYNEWADDAVEGNFPIIFGDLQRGYLIGKRVEFSIQRFDDSYYAMRNQVLFLARARVGGQVWQPAALKVLKIGMN